MELCRTYGALEWGGVSFGDRIIPCPVLCRAYSTLIRNIEIHYSLFIIHYSLFTIFLSLLISKKL